MGVEKGWWENRDGRDQRDTSEQEIKPPGRGEFPLSSQATGFRIPTYFKKRTRFSISVFTE